MVSSCESLNNGTGITVGQDATPELTSNTCRANKLAGIEYVDMAGGTAHNNTCTANMVGISIGNQATPSIQANTCRANDGAGIEVMHTAAPTLDGNTCADHRKGGRGIDLMTTGPVIVRNNTCTANTDGISISRGTPLLETNTCSGNEGSGIDYMNDSRGRAYKNVCTRNQRGINLAMTASVELEKNNCSENRNAGLYYYDQSSGVSRKNTCDHNNFGIFVGEQASPELSGNGCANNYDSGIRYQAEAAGGAHRNECRGNDVGIAVTERASPALNDNTCEDNRRTDIYVESTARPSLGPGQRPGRAGEVDLRPLHIAHERARLEVENLMRAGEIPDTGPVYNPLIDDIKALFGAYAQARGGIDSDQYGHILSRLSEGTAGILMLLERSDPAAAVVAHRVAQAGYEIYLNRAPGDVTSRYRIDDLMKQLRQRKQGGV